MQAQSSLWTHAEKVRIRAPVLRVWLLPPLWRVLYPAVTASMLWLRETTRRTTWAVLSGKRLGLPLQSNTHERPRKSASTDRPAAP
jgi:hypothetical protein